MTRKEVHDEVMELFSVIKVARERGENASRQVWERLAELTRLELESADAHIEATNDKLNHPETPVPKPNGLDRPAGEPATVG
jgi:hypothetical protein